jgi:hypothetical protein
MQVCAGSSHRRVAYRRCCLGDLSVSQIVGVCEHLFFCLTCGSGVGEASFSREAARAPHAARRGCAAAAVVTAPQPRVAVGVGGGGGGGGGGFSSRSVRSVTWATGSGGDGDFALLVSASRPVPGPSHPGAGSSIGDGGRGEKSGGVHEWF